MVKKINIPKEILYQKYEMEKRSGRDIAIMLKVSSAVIYRNLKKYNILIRSNSESTRLSKKLIGFAYIQKHYPERFIEFQKEMSKRGKKVEKDKKVGLYDPTHKIQKIGNKKSLKIQKENGNGFYRKDKSFCSKAGKIGGKRTRELHPNIFRENGINSIEKIREKSPYIWEGVGFLSNEERKCAKIILTKPIVGVNCHIKLKGGIIDFHPQENDKMFQEKFVEYHPTNFSKEKTLEEYFEKRRKILNENGFSDKELVLIKSLSELNNVHLCENK